MLNLLNTWCLVVSLGYIIDIVVPFDLLVGLCLWDNYESRLLLPLIDILQLLLLLVYWLLLNDLLRKLG